MIVFFTTTLWLQEIQHKSATRNLHEGFKLGHVTKATNDIKEVS